MSKVDAQFPVEGNVPIAAEKLQTLTFSTTYKKCSGYGTEESLWNATQCCR